MANVPCPHCGKLIDVVQLVYANASLKELERALAQAEFDKAGHRADEYTKAKGE